MGFDSVARSTLRSIFIVLNASCYRYVFAERDRLVATIQIDSACNALA